MILGRAPWRCSGCSGDLDGPPVALLSDHDNALYHGACFDVLLAWWRSMPPDWQEHTKAWRAANRRAARRKARAA